MDPWDDKNVDGNAFSMAAGDDTVVFVKGR